MNFPESISFSRNAAKRRVLFLPQHSPIPGGVRLCRTLTRLRIYGSTESRPTVRNRFAGSPRFSLQPSAFSLSAKRAFTLIEMLVVIAIIGIVAALVINMNVGAQVAKRNTMVNAEKMKLTGMIANYQSKLNYYPPDNGNLATTNLAYYDATAAVNPLIYELTGATNNPADGSILTFDGTVIRSNDFYTVFVRTAVANSSTDEPRNFFQPLPQPKEYTNYYTFTPMSNAYGSNVWGLVVPVTLMPNFTNFWHYDCSTTNRHNMSSYDLWAEYSIGSRNGTNLIVTNGNWQ